MSKLPLPVVGDRVRVTRTDDFALRPGAVGTVIEVLRRRDGSTIVVVDRWEPPASGDPALTSSSGDEWEVLPRAQVLIPRRWAIEVDVDRDGMARLTFRDRDEVAAEMTCALNDAGSIVGQTLAALVKGWRVG